MIYPLIFLDLLINSYSHFCTYFFLIFLYNKSYLSYLLVGLIFDLLLFNTYFISTIIFTIIYFSNKIFKDIDKESFLNYLLINLFNFELFIILSNIIFNNFMNSISVIGKSILLYLIFISLSYRLINRK